METKCCLIVDDEPDIRDLLCMTLERMNVECTPAATVREAILQLMRKPFDLCLTDMKLPDGDGIELVSYIQKEQPLLPVAIITAFGSMESAIAALKAGAFDFITKPVDLTNLRSVVAAALQLNAQSTSLLVPSLPQLLGESPPMQELRAKIIKLARGQAPVSILGESGTGKELVARLIHAQSPRADQPFVPVNCGAIPSELMESELFGHKKGSFSGATHDKDGLFMTAQNGTLFLDEIAELPLHMQVKLLRAIQEKQIRPVGAQHEITVNVRLLSATHKDLNQLVLEGLFRHDLFYRVNVIEIQVPPLRERKADIPLLVKAFIQRLCQRLPKHAPCPQPSKEAMDALQQYDFPGNVRELENIIERALTLCEGNIINVSDLQLSAPESKTQTPASPSNMLMTSRKKGPMQKLGEGDSLDPRLCNVEREAILDALEKSKWNQTVAAKTLGLNVGALRYRMTKLKLYEVIKLRTHKQK